MQSRCIRMLPGMERLIYEYILDALVIFPCAFFVPRRLKRDLRQLCKIMRDVARVDGSKHLPAAVMSICREQKFKGRNNRFETKTNFLPRVWLEFGMC